MPSRGDSMEKLNPRGDNPQGESHSAPEQQGLETDLSSDGPPTQQGAANHPNRAYRVCQTDASYRGTVLLISPEEAAREIRTQGFPPRESGMSPDGFPSRSMEDGGVSGLFGRRASVQVSSDSTSSEIPDPSCPSSPGSVCADSSTSGEYDASVHTARAVPLRRLGLGRRGDETPNRNREPSPAALDRIDDQIEDCERVWTDGPRRAAGQTCESREQEHSMLTGGTETSIDPYSQGSNVAHPTGRAGELPAAPGGHHAQPRRVSPTPSESSIAETVFNVRLPTPPPHQPTQLGHQSDTTASLPSSQRHAVTAAGPSADLWRGPSYPDPNAVQRELVEVPAVLVPGGLSGLVMSRPRQPP